MGFLFFPMMTMGLRLAALRATGAPLLFSCQIQFCRYCSQLMCPYLQWMAVAITQC